tara:strand:+ start:3758 stop:4333 length:576 start_codon:yes stop_codon:yes gene_type:complete
MSRIITKNRDPRVNEFGPNDLVLNTTTGDLFLKSKNQLFTIIGRNKVTGLTTDAVLQLLDDATEKVETSEGTGLDETIKGFKISKDGFYSLETSNPTIGSGISIHGGIPSDFGLNPLPNSPYIKTNGGFDILMDNANSHDNSEFRIFKDTGLANVSPGVELLKVDNNGNLTVAGTISGSSIITTDIDGGSF